MVRASELSDRLADRMQLSIPPFEMRELVGPTDIAEFDNPHGELVFGSEIEPELYDNVLDFGCGCGRLARRLIQQTPRPRHYVGIDLHRGMIKWDQDNLTVPGFEFHHHNVYYSSFNPDPTAPRVAPFPVADGSISLLIAYSVFTHLTQFQCEHYLRETARVLRSDGVMLSTWFLFDKAHFPMMQDCQNTLYINDIDITNATIFDATWIASLTRELGLTIRSALPPVLKGFAWTLQFTPTRPGVTAVTLPEDHAPVGRLPAPVGHPPTASTIGLR